MSHVDQGPLAAYNSLADNNLSGYFTNTRMRRHLKKAGLVNKYGEIVAENTYRLNMSRREHKQHVKDMLAQAIVHKTLDLERTRQAEIRRKLEEIAKIELVRRVRSSRQSKREADILPYISPRSTSSRPSSGPEPHPPVGGGRRSARYRKSRPISDPPRSRKKRPISALSSNYDEDAEGDVVYLDDEGRPITPAHVDESQLRYSSRDPIDTRHLYSLDTAALRKYAALVARMEQGRGGTSPYLTPQVPLPPKSPRSSRAASARCTPRTTQRYRGDAGKSASPKRPSTANQAYLHPAPGSQKFKGQQESLCEVSMVYHGSSLSLSRELLPGRSRQNVVVEQQHCGGNTLTVFRDALEKGAKFSFISYRHRGYPFSLSIYIDGKMDCRVSTCCEYRHHKGGRIGGKKGHFSISGIQRAQPCYKCQVEKGIRVGNQAPRPKLKRPPEHQEEVVVVETAREPTPEPEPVLEAAATSREEQILVPVEDADNDQKDDEKYDEDFESGSSTEEEEALTFQPKDARGVEKTTGKVDINELTSEEEQDGIGPQLFAKPPRQKSAGKGRQQRKKSAGSRSSSSSSSDSEEEQTARGQAQTKVVTISAENAKVGQAATPVVVSTHPDAGRPSKGNNSGNKGGKGGNEEQFSPQRAEIAAEGKKEEEVKVINEEKKEKEEEKENKDERKRRGSSSSSSASSKGSTRDYSDSEKDLDKKAEETKESDAEERTYEIKEEKEERVDNKEKEEVAVPLVSMADEEKEEKEVVVVGEAAGGDDVAVGLPKAEAVAAVVEVKDAGNEEERVAPPSGGAPADVTDPQQEVEKHTTKRRNSGASTVSSSSVSSSSSSGSASIRDKGPNTLNDPTSLPVAGQNDLEGAEVKHVKVTQETKLEVTVQPTVASERVEEDKKSKEDSGSEDSDSDSSGSDNEDDEEKRSKTVHDDGGSKQTDVLALLAAKVEDEKKEDEEKVRIKTREEEERERQRKNLEAERERRRKLAEEQQESMAVTVPSVTVSRQTSGDSGSLADSSDSDNDDLDTSNKEKTSIIKTEADVHRKQSVASHDADSDSGAMHGGNDPDNVTSTTQGSAPPATLAPTVPDARPGSITPLLEKSRSMVEIKGVTLNKSQLYECADYLTSQSRISQVNLVNCGLDDDDVQKVVEALKLSPSDPVLLNLSLNPLSSACVSYLLDLLVAKPSIEAVLLQGTRLGDEGVETLVEGLLRQHAHKKERQGEKREALKELRELDLSDCKMGDDGARAVGRLLTSDMEVDTLTLSSNHAVSEHGWTLVGEALGTNTTLETLTLDHNLLADPGVKAVAVGLENNTSVTALDLNGVCMTEVGGRVLVELLKRNTTLLEITLTENPRLGRSVVDDIGKYIALNKTMGGAQSQSQ